MERRREFCRPNGNCRKKDDRHPTKKKRPSYSLTICPADADRVPSTKLSAYMQVYTFVCLPSVHPEMRLKARCPDPCWRSVLEKKREKFTDWLDESWSDMNCKVPYGE